MWPRVVEVMLGCWLAMSPVIFQRSEATARLWAIDLSASAVVMALAVLSYWRPLRHAHLGIIVVGMALVGSAYLSPLSSTAPPSGQNHFLVGLLLLMFAIMPNEGFKPPLEWREFDKHLKEKHGVEGAA